MHRHGKFVDIDCDGTHLIFHLAKAGWLRWYEEVPKAPARPGKGPIALRVRLSDGSGFDLTEAGNRPVKGFSGGMRRRIEGPDVAGRSVVVLEDTSTTGGSVLTACEALAEAGADIAAVAVIVHRADASRDAVEQAGHRYLSAYDISELEI